MQNSDLRMYRENNYDSIAWSTTSRDEPAICTRRSSSSWLCGLGQQEGESPPPVQERIHVGQSNSLAAEEGE